MSGKRALSFGLIAALVVVAVLLLVPGFATIVGRMIANLWVTVMAAVAGILGAFMS